MQPRSKHFLASAALAVMVAGQSGMVSAGAQPFIGEIMCAAFNFAPTGWAEMNGQLLPISQNTALFSLLGTTFGGDGRVTFALPDMQGRMLLGASNSHPMGESAGAESRTLSVANLPSHTHTVAPIASASDANAISPAGAVPASKARTTLYTGSGPYVAMAASTSSATGSGTPVSTMPPYVTVKCYIALQGIFPSRP